MGDKSGREQSEGIEDEEGSATRSSDDRRMVNGTSDTGEGER